MKAIEILQKCSTASRGFSVGEVVLIGDGISEIDAGALISCRRAVPTNEDPTDKAPTDKAPTGKK